MSVGDNATPKCKLMCSSLPLGYNVAERLKGMIWRDAYVEFSGLIPNFQQDDETLLFSSLQSTVQITNAKQKKIQTVWQWCDAFDIFMSVYLDKFPQHALAVIKHGNTVL